MECQRLLAGPNWMLLGEAKIGLEPLWEWSEEFCGPGTWDFTVNVREGISDLRWGVSEM